MLVDSSRQRDFFSNIRARWLRQLNLSQIRFDGNDPATTGGRANVDKEEFAFGQPLDLAEYQLHRDNGIEVGMWRTFVCFLSSVFTPRRRRSKKRLISSSTTHS
jgi:hypothetical protein